MKNILARFKQQSNAAGPLPGLQVGEDPGEPGRSLALAFPTSPAILVTAAAVAVFLVFIVQRLLLGTLFESLPAISPDGTQYKPPFSTTVNLKLGEGEETDSSSENGDSEYVQLNELLIQAEDYDVGGQNISYYDTDSGNDGNVYRFDDVDIDKTSENGRAEYSVGWMDSNVGKNNERKI